MDIFVKRILAYLGKKTLRFRRVGIKIITVIGARPQFIKASSVSREFLNYSAVEEVVIHTGQHYDENMSDIFFSELQIESPKYLLAIGGLTHGQMIGRMIEQIEEICLKERPDWILVYGDTNSTLAGALVARKLNIKLAHVEAGLRSYNMSMPEEVNRILTDRISNILFCPTPAAVSNLKREGYDSFTAKIMNVGDVMLDSTLFYQDRAIKPKIEINDHFILATVHRAENLNSEDKIRSIFKALSLISEEQQVIVPLHPHTRKICKDLSIDVSNLTVIDPVGYLQMIWLIKHCSVVVTDSGGLQKEAFFSKKQCITLRDETEWVELVENNFNVLVGADTHAVSAAVRNHPLIDVDFDIPLYGDGTASIKIAQALITFQE